jgi:hypothetical protein
MTAAHISLQFTRSGLLQLRTSRDCLPPRTFAQLTAISHRELSVHEVQSLVQTLDRTIGRTQLPTVLLLLCDVTAEPRKCRDPSPLLRIPSVYTCRLATGTCLPQHCVERSQRDSVRHGSAQRKHRSAYCCVIAGTCFEVTVLAWSKYATILK